MRQPSKIFLVGPGTVVSIHLLDLPFSERHWVVKYKIDGGELIEVWHPGKNVPVLVGMHGMLTYSTHPEMILNFRVVQQNLTK